MEKTLIVDENDNPVGSKFRKDIVLCQDIYRVAALWIVNSQDEILLARRPFHKSSPGRWGPAAAGTLEEGETYRSNIVKEAEEEIGLKNINPEDGPKFRVKTKTRDYFCQYFTLHSDRPADKFKFKADEVVSVKWMPREKLKQDIKQNPKSYVPSFVGYIDSLLEKI